MEYNHLYNNKDELRSRKQPSVTEKEMHGTINSSLKDTHQGYRKEHSDIKFLKAARNIIFITLGILSIVLISNFIRSLKSPNSNIDDRLNPNIDEGPVSDKVSISKSSINAKGEHENFKQSIARSNIDGLSYSPAKKYKDETQNQCFCQLQGHVDDCSCSVDTVDHYNNIEMFPRLQSLLAKDYFKYFQYNPNKPCQFWTKSSGIEPPEKCMSPTCGVKPCTSEELPPGIKGEIPSTLQNCMDTTSPDTNLENGDKVDSTLSEVAKQDIKSWKDHDDKIKGFCEVDDKNDPNCVHVDLTINPERYTGYSGEASRKVWRAIYQENCFRPPNSTDANSSISTNKSMKGNKKKKLSEIFGVRQERIGELCLEKRAFYRAISGLHTSITIHLSSRFPEGELRKTKATRLKNVFAGGPGSTPPFVSSGDENYIPNIDLFLSRFDPDLTDGQGPFWLKNLYFVYLLELRALQKAAPFLEKHTFYTGNEEEDRDTTTAVKEILKIVDSFPNHFDESSLFASSDSSELLKNEFREHFRNVSKVMDCVACDKCKLWGKLQITGLGTALKILFTEESQEHIVTFEGEDVFRNHLNEIDLNRNEIVSLFNAFGRISTSIQQLESLREKLRSEKT